MEELSENAGETIHTKERGDVLQQVRTKEAGYGDMPEVPAADTARGGSSRETMQGIRGEEAKLTKKEENEGENSEKVSPSVALADKIADRLVNGKEFNSAWLFEQADKLFVSTQAEGKYSPKDAYDYANLPTV